MKFQVGDRVRVYHGHKSFKGTIKDIHNGGGGLLYVMEDGFYSYPEDAPFSPKQCRKLVKKERRRVWISYLGKSMNEVVTIPQKGPHWVEFVEVKRKCHSKTT